MNDLTTIMALGGAGGLVAGCWGYIKGIFARITGLLIVRLTISHGLTDAVETLIWKDFKPWRSSFPTYGANYWFVQPAEKYQRVGYEKVGSDALLFWKGWKPLLISYQKEGEMDLTMKFIRGTFNPDTLISEALTRYNLAKAGDEDGRFEVVKFQGKGRSGNNGTLMVGQKGKKKDDEDDGAPRVAKSRDEIYPNVRLLGYARDELGQPKEGCRAIERLALDTSALQAITEARHWAKSGSWYREREIPWRRGWLLYGPPGTGKSSLSAAIAQDLGLPLYVFDLGSMSNKELTGFWSQAIGNTPAVVLIEDIDAVFRGRENVLGEDGGGLSFDALLNTISGVQNADGIFLIITTNNLEHIDPALGLPQAGSNISTRPGRIDRALKLDPPNVAGRRKIATRILAAHGTPELIESLVNAGAGDSGAQFQERVAMYALNLYWTNHPSETP